MKLVLVRAVIVLLMTASVLYIAFTAFACARSEMRRKWLWCFVAVIGVFRLGVNWSTGVAYTNLFTMTALGIGMTPLADGSWLLSVSLPAGALIVRQRLSALQEGGAERATARSN